jgi:sulfur-oxidizing protein SoxA
MIRVSAAVNALRSPSPADRGVRRVLFGVCGAFLALSALAAGPAKPAAKSGLAYAGADVRALQSDDFGNPGMLWVARGEKLWNAAAGRSEMSCASCHRDAPSTMKGVAARYPRLDTGSRELLNLEARINQCREQRQGADALRYESDELLALTAYVAHQSRGMPVKVDVSEANRAHYERGREIYYRRQGQMNLACTHCHEQNAGRKLLADTISEGHGNAYPVYRLEWQSAGSLHRRLRACYFGVRAEQPAAGSAELIDLELYLATRARGLAVETPGVRR